MIQEWFDRSHTTSPLTAAPLANMTLIPNQSIKSMIIEFLEQHPKHAPTATLAPDGLPFQAKGDTGSGGATGDVGGAGESSGTGAYGYPYRVIGNRSSRKDPKRTSQGGSLLLNSLASENKTASAHEDHAEAASSNSDARRAVVLAGVHQAEVHTRRLGVLPAYQALVAERTALVAELEAVRNVNVALESQITELQNSSHWSDEDEEVFGFPSDSDSDSGSGSDG